MPGIKRALLIASACLVLNACAFLGGDRDGIAVTPVSTVKQERRYWYCQPNETWDDWDCVQDPRQAMKPVSRPPRKQTPVEPVPITGVPSIDTPDPLGPDEPQVAAVRTQAEVARDEVQAPAYEPLPGPAPSLVPGTQSTGRPDWQRLAYPLSASVTLNQLPAHFYAVQIVAMSSSEALEVLAKEHRQSGLLATRVEANGELYYVLLLGIYETFRDAESAIASRPGSMMYQEPWIRKLGSLQNAVARADVLAETIR
jgi:septal ring-binding cell division protein DamX